MPNREIDLKSFRFCFCKYDIISFPVFNEYPERKFFANLDKTMKTMKKYFTQPIDFKFDLMIY